MIAIVCELPHHVRCERKYIKGGNALCNLNAVNVTQSDLDRHATAATLTDGLNTLCRFLLSPFDLRYKILLRGLEEADLKLLTMGTNSSRPYVHINIAPAASSIAVNIVPA